MWSDSVRQVSYLGITATFVNDQFEYRSYDRCCAPFEEDDKTAESVIAVSVVVCFSLIELLLSI